MKREACTQVRWSERVGAFPRVGGQHPSPGSQCPGLASAHGSPDPRAPPRGHGRGASPTPTQSALLCLLLQDRLNLGTDPSVYRRLTNTTKDLTNGERIIYLVNESYK